MNQRAAEADRKFFMGLARAFGGAVFFSLPLLMTMEMWAMAGYLRHYRLALLIVLILPLLLVLDRLSGFMETSSWGEDAVDALIGFGVGAVAATIILAALGILTLEMPLRESVGHIAIQAVPGSFGAVLANSQFGSDREETKEAVERRGGFAAQLLFMITGAVFLAFNIAPTEEIVALSAGVTPVHTIVIVLLTLGMMHAFVYAAGFRGSPGRHASDASYGLFLRYTLTGYVVALVISAYVLWTFGRMDGASASVILAQTVILGLPAGLGAAAARIVL
jgi:putative integral membrane protein (TIGR02587 family)